MTTIAYLLFNKNGSEITGHSFFPIGVFAISKNTFCDIVSILTENFVVFLGPFKSFLECRRRFIHLLTAKSRKPGCGFT